MKESTIIWSYILLEGYCTFGIYSDKKKVKCVDENGKSVMEKNNNYLPKSKLKRPKGCPFTPSHFCLRSKCRFFEYAKGNFNEMSYERFRQYRDHAKKNPKDK